MPWPTPQDYNEAVQNPQSNFDDPELQTGTPELTPLGLPRPITGGFASVYKLKCGARDWAVRCFLREFADQQHRYAAISRHLSAARLPYTVGFEYLPKGIRVRGQWYPILKMEWVHGVPLNVYIEHHLHDPAALQLLADRWVTLVRTLRRANIAHGDLQHGNVLVANDALKIIDYDGMYVPSLAGQASHEVGHRNYQHPQRGMDDFGPFLDDFSAWVIYVSLVALRADPDLWTESGAGDEHLLFRKEDFEQPTTSPILTLLRRDADPQVRALGAEFQELICRSPQDLPLLEGPGAAAGGSGTAALLAAWARPLLQRVAALRFVPPGLRDRFLPAPVVAQASAASSAPDWMRDYLAPEGPRKAFPASGMRNRLLLALVASMAVGDFWLVPGAASLPLALLKGLMVALTFNALYLFTAYWQEPLVRERRALQARERERRRAVEAIERTLQRYEVRRQGLLAEEEKQQKELARRKTVQEVEERLELKPVHEALKKTRDTLQERRKELAERETAELRELLTQIGPEVKTREHELEDVRQARAAELADALQKHQQAHQDAYLRRQTLWKATIPGISAGLKLRLRLSGIGSAADVDAADLNKLPGVNARRAEALKAWREKVEARAAETMPDALDEAEARRLSARFDRRQQGLEARLEWMQRQLTGGEEEIRARFEKQSQDLEAEQAAAQARAAERTRQLSESFARRAARIDQARDEVTAQTAAQMKEIDVHLDQARAPLPGENWKLTEARRALAPYTDLTFPHYLRSLFKAPAKDAAKKS